MGNEEQILKTMKENLGFEIRRDESQNNDGSVDVEYTLVDEVAGEDLRDATEHEIELWEALRACLLAADKEQERIKELESLIREAEKLCDEIVNSASTYTIKGKIESQALSIGHMILILEVTGKLSRKAIV